MASIRDKFEKAVAIDQENEETLQQKEINDRKNLREKIQADIAERQKITLFNNQLNEIKNEIIKLKGNFHIKLKSRL